MFFFRLHSIFLFLLVGASFLVAAEKYQLNSIQGAARSKQKVLLIVDNKTAQNETLNSAIYRYADDIHSAFGMAVQVHTFPSPEEGGTAVDLRSFLQNSRDSLNGAILIGNLPRATFEFIQNPGTASIRYQRWITDFYFMDLDGTWLDTAAGWAGSTGGLVLDRIDATPNFASNSDAPSEVPADSFSVRWTGFLKAPETGLCSLAIISDNQRRLWLKDSLVIDAWVRDWDYKYSGATTLVKGELTPVQIDYAEEWGGANFHIYWKLPSATAWILIPDSVWFSSDNSAGLNASYFANVWLQTSEKNKKIGYATGWKSDTSNGVFDGHYAKDGSVADSMEIWISRLDPNTAGLLGNPTALLQKYLDKLHLWNSSKANTQSKSVYFITADADTTSASDRKFILGLSAIYGRDSLDVILADSAEYATNIANPAYGWATYVGHGDPLYLGNGFRAKDLRGYSVGPRIFHFASCSPLENYDIWGNPWSISVGSAHIFGTVGGGFVSIGASKTSGDNQLDDLMYYAAVNNTIGDAYLSWINERIHKNTYSPREGIFDWFYAETLIGDPLQSGILVPEYPVSIYKKSIEKVSSKFKSSTQNWDATGRMKNGNSTARKIWLNKSQTLK